MRLLVVRHGIAAPRESFDGPDAARPLTDAGRTRMERGARGIARLVPELECIWTSPLVRARQTAQILAAAYAGKPALGEAAWLRPGADLRELAARLGSEAHRESVAIVGHEPDLSIAVSWLAAGVDGSFAPLGKGGAALLDLPGRIDAARATLLWLLRPGQLRRLA